MMPGAKPIWKDTTDAYSRGYQDGYARGMARMREMLEQELENLDTWLYDQNISDKTKKAMLLREYEVQRVLQALRCVGSLC